MSNIVLHSNGSTSKFVLAACDEGVNVTAIGRLNDYIVHNEVLNSFPSEESSDSNLLGELVGGSFGSCANGNDPLAGRAFSNIDSEQQTMFGAESFLDIIMSQYDKIATRGLSGLAVDGFSVPAPDYAPRTLNQSLSIEDGKAVAAPEMNDTQLLSASEVTTMQTELSLAGFSDERVVIRPEMNAESPFFQPISMTFLPDNRMLLLSKDGEILIVDPESGHSSTYMTLSNINTGGERGLLDITLDPNFEENGYFYIYYTPGSPAFARIARFEHQDNSGGLTSSANPESEFLVWQDTEGYLACCHYGAGVDFGLDGKLWLTTSDKFRATSPGEGPANSQDIMLDLSQSSGKIIRVNPDGTVPDGNDGWPANPGYDPNNPDNGYNDYVWAYGLRNPFRARWDLEYGQMYIAEVGGNQQFLAHEDLHVANLEGAGAFYGWPFYEGTPSTYVNDSRSPYDPSDFPLPDDDPANTAEGDFYSAPIWSLPHDGTAASMTGGEVYRGDMFPENWQGVYFYGDYTRNYIRYLVLDETGTQVLGDFPLLPSAALQSTTNGVVSIAVGEDGALYYAMIGTGEVRRVVFGDNDAPVIAFAGVTSVLGEAPLSVTFEAQVSDLDGDPMTYMLNLGDGTVSTGMVGSNGIISVEHVYITDGSYAISLSVSDGIVNVFSEGFHVEVGFVNSDPIITGTASNAQNVDPGQTVTFTAMAVDPDNDNMTYTWYFGDGSSASGVVEPSGEVTATHSYAADGNYQARLEVSDGTATTVSSILSIQVGDAVEVPVTDGLVLNLQSDIKIGLGVDSTVTAWLDGSGQGNNLFAEGDPQLVANQTPTGQAAIVFDGVDDLLQRGQGIESLFNLPSGSADRTIFTVIDYIDPERTTSGVVYGDAAANKAFGLTVNKNGILTVQGWGGKNDLPSGVDGVSGGFMVQSVVLSDNTTFHYKDGILIDSDAKTFNTDVHRLVLGAELGTGGETQMKISAVLIYDRALSEIERIEVEAFLQSKYLSTHAGNNPPVAVADEFIFIEDVPLQGNVLANDSDPDGDPLTAALVTGPDHGTVMLNPNGNFTYTPVLNFDGTDEFIYSVSDGKGGISQATVTLIGVPVDDTATAVDDSYSALMNTALVVDEFAGVLANDFDPEGDPFSAELITGPSNGALTLNANGSFIYAPILDFQGEDSFVYQVTGGGIASVTITVGPELEGLVTDGLVASYRSDENVSMGSGDLVLGWLDGSGRGNDLIALGDPRLLQGATPTGMQAIEFDGTGDLLQRINSTDTLSGLVEGSGDRSMFLVVRYIASEGVSSGIAYGDSQANETFGLTTRAKDNDLMLQGYGGRNDFDSNVNGPAQGWMVQSVVLDDAVFHHYLNGTLIDTKSKTFNTDVQRLIIGADMSGKGESNLQVAGALVYDRALTEPERMSIETYLQQTFIDDAFTFV